MGTLLGCPVAMFFLFFFWFPLLLHVDYLVAFSAFGVAPFPGVHLFLPLSQVMFYFVSSRSRSAKLSLEKMVLLRLFYAALVVQDSVLFFLFPNEVRPLLFTSSFLTWIGFPFL